MTVRPKPTVRRVYQHVEALERSYRDRAATAAERGDAENERVYRTVAEVLRRVLGVLA